jgi:hypothetical protein
METQLDNSRIGHELRSNVSKAFREEMTTMLIYEVDGTNQPDDTEAYYEAVASQEEIYLEETEEELRVILECGIPSPPPSETPDQQLDDAAEYLITGDSDDPPLSEEAVEGILKMD